MDEFLVIVDNSTSLPALLQDYEDYGGLAVSWRMFGSSEAPRWPPPLLPPPLLLPCTHLEAARCSMSSNPCWFPPVQAAISCIRPTPSPPLSTARTQM